MINFRKAITVCVDKDYNLDVHCAIDRHIDTTGTHHVYLDGDKVYIGFETKSTVGEVANILKKALYKVDTKIVGGLVIV